MLKSTRVVETALAVACWSLASCGTSDAPSAAPTSTVSGAITYAGPAAASGRPLAIAVYPTFPPQGPPVVWRIYEAYTFPFQYSFQQLPPGSYVVGASIDVDPTDTPYLGQLNAKRDPYGYSAGGRLIAVDEQRGAAGIDIALEDPK